MRDEHRDDDSPPSSEADFWAWSLERYAREGVESLSLRLQDEFALNVNMALWSCWCATRYETAPDIVVRKAMDVSGQWSAGVTAPLRGARRFLKGRREPEGSEDLRRRVKAAELRAEELEQMMLEALARSALTPAAAKDDSDVRMRARRNLATYAALAGTAKTKGFSTSLLHDFIDRIFGAEPANGADRGESR